jgi:uncharacterized protein YutE (UPF0331/DUF86 family)
VSALDAEILAARVATVGRHLRRVADKTPKSASDLVAATDTSDAVILHLWMAVQQTIDLATALCVRLGLGVPESYRDAFERLSSSGYMDAGLASRLARAAGFRNVVAHAYEGLDMAIVHRAAVEGPEDLRAFLRVARDLVVR